MAKGPWKQPSLSQLRLATPRFVEYIAARRKIGSPWEGIRTGLLRWAADVVGPSGADSLAAWYGRAQRKGEITVEFLKSDDAREWLQRYFPEDAVSPNRGKTLDQLFDWSWYRTREAESA